MSEETYTGGCLCGAVKYQLSGTDKTIHGITACHCEQCRRWSGHHWASLIGPKSGFFITKGENNVRWYQSSIKARRGFCQTCGSTLFWHGFGYRSLKDQIDVSAGSLDDSKGRALVRHIFCENKGAYYRIKDGVPVYDRFPESEMLIKRDDLTGPEIQALLRDHLADAFANSPPDSVFALDLSALQKPDISFWSVWDDDVLLGCGALKELDKTHGEIKSMRTTSAALRRGVGSTMLAHIIEQAQTRGYKRLSLETGNNQPYAAARALYEKFGFEYCAPFADYEEGAFNLFMKLNL